MQIFKTCPAINQLLKPAALAVYFYYVLRFAVERFYDLGITPSFIAYLALLIYLSATIFIAAYLSTAPIRLIYASVLSFSSFMVLGYELVTGDTLTYDSYIVMANSIGFSSDALIQYQSAIAKALIISLCLFFGVALRPKTAITNRTVSIAGSPLIGVTVLAIILFVRGGDGAKLLPPAFPFLSYTELSVYEAITERPVARKAVTISLEKKASPKHVILLVDESVSGNYLDVCGSKGLKTPLTDNTHSDFSIHNYGCAVSINNCSAGTNSILRFGGGRSDYQSKIAGAPSIWAYAKAAGFQTVYIDGQRTGGDLQNLMNGEELKLIDRFVQFDKILPRDRDRAIADQLAVLLDTQVPTFIYVNKVGVHFPLNNKYPDDYLVFKPALEQNSESSLSDTHVDVRGGSAGWRLYRNSYRNALLWNVDAFFERLFGKADLSSSTIIYTSDHGQDLHERGNPGNSTHCGGNPLMEEGLVPLVVIEGKNVNSLDWAAHLVDNKDKVSHYQIFPTLLGVMGFNLDQTRHSYGELLTDKSTDPYTFNSLFNTRFGKKPNYVHVDLNNIVTPPESDYAAGK